MPQGTMSVASYYIKLKALWDELELYRSPIVCNQTKEHQIKKEEDKLIQFLMGLNDSFKTIRFNILVMNPLPNVRQAYSLIVQERIIQPVGTSPSMKVFSHSANSLRRNPHLYYKIFCPLLTLTYPLLSNIHSIHHLLLLVTMHLNL